jgi:nucleoside 2-deoxyribosyltransferase
VDHVNKICDQILAEVRAAELVVADFTGFRSGVFFEAGFAMALGKPVICTCRESHFDELGKHFDTRQYPHLKWTDPADLRAKLSTKLRALRQVPLPV